MASLNKCCFIGNVGKDPEFRSLNSGDRVANLSIACTEKWRDKSSGEQKERTEWVRLVVWNEGLVKVIENYVKKGSQIYIEGQMQTRKWTDSAGVEKYSTEIVLQKFQGTLVLLGGKRDDDGGGGGHQRDQGGGGGFQRSSPKESFPADLDDEIPF